MGLPRSCYQRMKFLLHYQEERRGKGPYLSTDYRGNPPRKVSNEPTRLCSNTCSQEARARRTQAQKKPTYTKERGRGKRGFHPMALIYSKKEREGSNLLINFEAEEPVLSSFIRSGKLKKEIEGEETKDQGTRLIIGRETEHEHA